MIPFLNFVAMRLVDGIYEIDLLMDGAISTVYLTDDDLDVICDLAEEYPI